MAVQPDKLGSLQSVLRVRPKPAPTGGTLIENLAAQLHQENQTKIHQERLQQLDSIFSAQQQLKQLSPTAVAQVPQRPRPPARPAPTHKPSQPPSPVTIQVGGPVSAHPPATGGTPGPAPTQPQHHGLYRF